MLHACGSPFLVRQRKRRREPCLPAGPLSSGQRRSVHGCHTTSAKSSRCFADHSGINAMSHNPPQQQERLRSRSSSCNEVTMNYATVLKSQRARGCWQGRRGRQSRPGRSAKALGAPSPALGAPSPAPAGAPAPRTALGLSSRRLCLFIDQLK